MSHRNVEKKRTRTFWSGSKKGRAFSKRDLYSPEESLGGRVG